MEPQQDIQENEIDLMEIISQLQEAVEDECGVEYSRGALRDMINVEGVQKTLVIKLSAESNDPEEPMPIANERVSTMDETGSEFAGLDNIEVLNEASMLASLSGTDRMLYMAVTFVPGGMIGTFIVSGAESLNCTIKTTKDMGHTLGLRVLVGIVEYYLEEAVKE